MHTESKADKGKTQDVTDFNQHFFPF